MRRFRPVLALLLVTAAVISWLLVDREPTEPPPVAQNDSHRVDYTVTNLDVTRMTAAGQPAHRLQAEILRHFVDDDTTELEIPHLTVYQGDESPWEIDAKHAWVSADGSLVLLTGEVIITRAAHANSPPVRMVTSEVRLQPRQDYAETDEKVRVETDTDRLDAVGMQAWLRPPSRLKFLSQVKGYYVPR